MKGITLPFGLSWFPSKHDRKYIVVRVADPLNRSKTITNYKRIPAGCDLDLFVADLVAYRDKLGSSLWDDWPDVARPRKEELVSGLPKGVSCSLIRNKGGDAFISVTAYWQDYSKPKNKNGQFRQSKKTYRLPLGSPESVIYKTVQMAKEYREERLRVNPKPSR